MAHVLKALLATEYLEAKHLSGFDSYKVKKFNMKIRTTTRDCPQWKTDAIQLEWPCPAWP